MSEPELSPEEKEFADQLKTLFSEAQHHMGLSEEVDAPVEAVREASDKPVIPASRRQEESPNQGLKLLQMMRPLVMGIEALTRATTENSAAIGRLQESVTAQEKVPEMLKEIHRTLEQKTGVNQQLFDSLHGELKSYKDNFLLEVFHKPIVRDLVTLYDDLSTIRNQNIDFEHELREQEEHSKSSLALLERMGTLNANLDHSVAALLEVMARMDVQLLPASCGKLDKNKHRAIAIEVTDSKTEDNDIVRTVKYGFRWRERPVRPEEVIIKKYKEGCLIAIPAPQKGNEDL